MKLRKPRLYLRDLKGAEGLQAFYLVYNDHEGKEKRRSLSAQIYGQPFPKTNATLAAACRVQAERIAQAAHIIRRIPSQQEREHIMQQLEQEGDFTAEGIEAVRRAVG